MKKIEEIIQTKFVSNQQKAIVNLRYTSNYLSNIQNNFMIEFDLTMPQFNVLRILRGSKSAISIQDIKERMVEKSPNTTRLLDKLVDKGFVERSNSVSSDKRKNFIAITESGLEVLSQIDSKISNEDFFQNKLTDEEAETLSSLLDKLRS
jgi:MarR family 2-MHQ and catechol resistance regulon transcriptional repressor